MTLLGQANVWGEADGATIETIANSLEKKLGAGTKLTGFVRFELGEGIEKKTDDLAAEVAKTIGN